MSATSAPTHRRSTRATAPHHDERSAARGRHPSAKPGPPRPPGDRSSTFLGLLIVTAALVLLGLVMVLSAASVSDLRTSGSAWVSFERQSIYAAVGVIGMAIAWTRDYQVWRRVAKPLLLLSFVLLGLVLVPGVGAHVNGSTRWIGAGPIRLQPSELAKLALIVWSARLLDERQNKIRDARCTLRPILVMLGVAAVLLMLQPNLGTLVIAVTAVGAVVFVAGVPLWRLGLWGGIGIGLAGVAAIAEPYRRARVLSYLNPWADRLNSGWQTIQSQVGIATGGLTGVGLGASRAKWGFLPYAHTDFIFAIIAEELGLIGAFVVLLLFLLVGLFGFQAALRAPDLFGRLLAAGITTWFVVQAAVNIGAVVGLLPITGVPLPFVSYGGSALVVNLVAMGVLLSVARQSLPEPRARR